MTTRRQLLAAAIAAPAITLPSVSHATITAGTSAEWKSAKAAAAAACERMNRFHTDVYMPARDRWLSTVANAEADLERRIEAIPHYTTARTIEMTGGGRRSMSTAFQMDVLVAADFNRRRDDLGREDADLVACCLELHPEAVRRREAEAAMRESFIKPEIDPAVWAECERLESESNKAWERVAFFKAATLPDLTAKINFLKSEECPIEHDDLLADLARIFGEARS
ncbi:MAG: hypothetical protein WBL20_19215 [Sphingobium sp.]|uniref:hypothetical protein n=1 Tax=Sphingobium sp. TaxID=1912891 RepID=UPI003BAF827B